MFLYILYIYQGWQGTVCDEDTDECKGDDICAYKSNSHCHNTNGSFSCSCNVGFEDNKDQCEGMPKLVSVMSVLLICLNTLKSLQITHILCIYNKLHNKLFTRSKVNVRRKIQTKHYHNIKSNLPRLKHG